MARKSKLLDEVRAIIRVRHFSYRAEKAYVGWIYRLILYHGKSHPRKLHEPHVAEYLFYLANTRRVAAATQNQALHASNPPCQP